MEAKKIDWEAKFSMPYCLALFGGQNKKWIYVNFNEILSKKDTNY